MERKIKLDEVVIAAGSFHAGAKLSAHEQTLVVSKSVVSSSAQAGSGHWRRRRGQEDDARY
jgi:hypothetical protein